MKNLQFLSDWKEGTNRFIGKRSAQSYMGANQYAMVNSGACGSSCGTGDDDKPETKPTACGSACGAGDK